MLAPVNTAFVIGDAMTDYLLAAGTNTAPASGAPAHMAAWMESRGYRIVRSLALRPGEPGGLDEVARIVGSIDWQHSDDEYLNRRSIVCQILAAAEAMPPDSRWVA